ncbi:MAG: aliphatic sulfonate ABC transporter substrate-binding protein [Acidimicrobiales bacterium]
MRTRHLRRPVVGALSLVLLAAACGSDDETSTTPATDGGGTVEGGVEGGGEGQATEEAATSSETLTLGYSAWPGWFPLAVAEEAGIFEEVGLDVDLRFFADYLGSLDAMAAGQLDGNTQTLNDTMFSDASGSDQVIVVVNDNSTGNDAIICDESVTSIEDLEGRTVAAEPGVVDHFLLLQGLESVGLTEDDIDFRGVLTGDAAAGFAAGEFDCVGVFAPFTVQALEREGSAVLFDSADFPGTIPDHIVVSPELIAERPGDVQALVDAWYLTLDYIEDNPEESIAIMADVAEVSPEEYEAFAEGTTLFSLEDALAAFEDGDDTSSLQFTADLINPFLVESGLSETEADLEGLFDPSFTQDYAERVGG